jgi:O-glycosyl hydrolase
MVKPALDDPIARQYADIIAVHGYDLDGITAASPNAQTWQTMYGWGAAYHKPLWMTETSGFAIATRVQWRSPKPSSLR